MKGRQCGMSNLAKQMMDLMQQQKKITDQLHKFYEQKKREYDLLGYNVQIVEPSDCTKLPELKLVKRIQKEQMELRSECIGKFISQYNQPNMLISCNIDKFIDALKQNGIDISFTRRLQTDGWWCKTQTYNITDIDECIQKLKDTGKCDEVSIYQFMAKLDENGKLQVYVRMQAKSDYPQLTSMVNNYIDEYEKAFKVNRAEVHQTYKKFIDILKHNNIEVAFIEKYQSLSRLIDGNPIEIAYSPYITTMHEINEVVKYLLSENVYKIQINRVHLCRQQFADEYCRPSDRWGDACQIRFFRHYKLKLKKDTTQEDIDDIATITHTQSKYKTSKEWYDDMKIAMDLISNTLKDKFWDIKVDDEVEVDFGDKFGGKLILKVSEIVNSLWFTVMYGEKRVLFSIKTGEYLWSYANLQENQQFTKWAQKWKALRIRNRKLNSANWVKMSKDCSDFVQQIAKQKNMTVQQVVSKFLGTETEVMKTKE